MDLREHIQAVYDKHGRLNADLVVAAARPKRSPLHPYVFDRAPADAAEAWYRHRAHELIRSVEVVYKQADETGAERRVRAFHSVHDDRGYAFEPAEKVADDPFLARLVLQQMEREYRALQARYGGMAEFVALARETVEQAA
jgi:hypothetical protein